MKYTLEQSLIILDKWHLQQYRNNYTEDLATSIGSQMQKRLLDSEMFEYMDEEGYFLKGIKGVERKLYLNNSAYSNLYNTLALTLSKYQDRLPSGVFGEYIEDPGNAVLANLEGLIEKVSISKIKTFEKVTKIISSYFNNLDGFVAFDASTLDALCSFSYIFNMAKLTEFNIWSRRFELLRNECRDILEFEQREVFRDLDK